MTAAPQEETVNLTASGELEDALERHPDFPRHLAIKIDTQRRGVFYTPRALAHVDPEKHQLRSPYLFGSRDNTLSQVPESLLLHDGTTILTDPTPLEKNPYRVDWREGEFALVDGDQTVVEVELWPKPDYYGKTTRSGTPMNHVFTARPQRLNFFLSGFCQFWANDKGCRFCDLVTHWKRQKKEWNVASSFSSDDIEETLREALREKGRFTNFCLTAGSNLNGPEIFDAEVDYYVEVLQSIGRVLPGGKFPSQLIGSAYNEKQLARLYEQTGLSSYTSDLEVFGEDKFDWVCPGKAEKIGYQEWKQRLIRAVDIFGRGNVGTGLVAGAELAKPHGWPTEDQALGVTLSEAENLAEKGVTTVYIVWVPRPGSYFHDQANASLDYYIRLAKGLHEIRARHGLKVFFDDYRRCGNHPDSDLSRLL
ncbi:MAG: radical SAM protein [Planctomycetota bacterium]|jgi:hypothetical protein|nr:radical SAM protein [Planctomycetota bacterium]